MPEGFVKKFDAKREDHCVWLKRVFDGMAKVTSGERLDIVRVFDDNPMGEKLSNPAELAYIHFQVAMKYAAAVLAKDAWVPGAADK